ncbi:uncharacterized protein LOC133116809 [Conger conger]|uniref:uncharacterized protein LOC133116809 n=1 Tax=Conger conger TaxID=82655 RepID=UPI002A5A1A8B|nr:uncharacterized protein LOC133116809 [Conger conger]
MMPDANSHTHQVMFQRGSYGTSHFESSAFEAMNTKTLGFVVNMRTVLILLASALFGECENITVNSVAGKDVLLPCSCRQSKEIYIVWQIGERVVDYNVNGERIPETIDHQFQGRTHLRTDSGNCSLQLINVTKEDEETYTCYYKNRELIRVHVILKVVEFSESGGSEQDPQSKTAPAIAGVLITVLLLTLVLAVRYREKCRRSQVNVPGPQEAEQMDPLSPEYV